jgi:hypothetical protein
VTAREIESPVFTTDLRSVGVMRIVKCEHHLGKRPRRNDGQPALSRKKIA